MRRPGPRRWLRYHIHINKLNERLTFHDQVGYWLWEPATHTLLQTLTIPRGQVAVAMGTAEPGARRFTVKATLGSPVAGIVSAPFLHENFRTVEYSITMTVNDDGTLSYEQGTVPHVARLIGARFPARFACSGCRSRSQPGAPPCSPPLLAGEVASYRPPW